jgi:hypothetical protein
MQLNPTPFFEKNVRRLTKKYPPLPEDIAQLGQSLLNNPHQGDSMGQDCFKVRLRIKSKNTGKSGGGRVITCVKIVDETIHILTIYDKSEKEDLEPGELDELLKQINL